MSFTAHVTGIFHDAESGMFEAYVTLDNGCDITNHVVTVPGSISTPFQTLRPALVRAAADQRKAHRFAFRTVRTESPLEQLHSRLLSEPSYLDRFLRRAA